MMATALLDGQRSWELERDEDGYRNYTLKLMVITDDPRDGPATVLSTSGLPVPGDQWLIDNDVDPWVWCRKELKVKCMLEDQPNKHWELSYLFSNKPLKDCQDDKIEDPLLQPPQVSGSFVRYNIAATHDRFGIPIHNSAFEPIHGPNVEFDANRPQVRIEMNVANLNLEVVSAMVDTVNDRTLWGLDKRCVKLSGFRWERAFYGTCNIYYKISLEFDINFDTFDRTIKDEGTMVLNGRWNGATGNWRVVNIGGSAPDPSNPSHMIRYTDRQGNFARLDLDGNGNPANQCIESNDPIIITNPISQVQIAEVTIIFGDPLSVGDTIVIRSGPTIEIFYTVEAGAEEEFAADTIAALVNDSVDPAVTGRFTAEGNADGKVTFTGVNPTSWPFTFFVEKSGAGAPTHLEGGIIQNALDIPVQTGTGTACVQTSQGEYTLQYYHESNFLLLGIPTNF